jgi:hypothetical protein
MVFGSINFSCLSSYTAAKANGCAYFTHVIENQIIMRDLFTI